MKKYGIYITSKALENMEGIDLAKGKNMRYNHVDVSTLKHESEKQTDVQYGLNTGG